MIVEKVGRNVMMVRMDVRGDGWEKWFLLTSDRHHDSRQCDKALVTEHLELAKSRDAHVLDFGDFFDAMQGKYDPRRSYPDMDPRFLDMMTKQGVGYLDAIVNDAVQFYKPYADRFILLARGNHETAIYNHNDTDLTNRLAFGLNSAAGTQIVTGEYGGWVKFHFHVGKTQKQTFNLKYFHGSGGGGPVTKGVIQSNRQAVFLPDADAVVNGHIHESWVLALPRERLTERGMVHTDMQFHVRTPTYKNDYGDGGSGWAVEKGMPPKPRGAVWMRFYRDRRAVRVQFLQDIR